MMEAPLITSSSSSRISVYLLLLRRRSSPPRIPAIWKPPPTTLHSKSKNTIIACVGGDSTVTLLNYGAGNVRGLRNAIRYLGFDIKEVQKPEDIRSANRLVFPGVGNFAAAMDVLNQNGMAEAVCMYMEQDHPFLGICLGL